MPRQGRPGQRSGEPAGKGIEQGHADTAAAVERRSRANLVRALNLLRCIKAVIEGLPPAEAEAVLSPGANAADGGAVGGGGGGATTPITQVMSKIDTAYKEAHGAALSLRSNMETALQTVASLQLPQGDGGGVAVDPAVWLKVLPSRPFILLCTLYFCGVFLWMASALSLFCDESSYALSSTHVAGSCRCVQNIQSM